MKLGNVFSKTQKDINQNSIDKSVLRIVYRTDQDKFERMTEKTIKDINLSMNKGLPFDVIMNKVGRARRAMLEKGEYNLEFGVLRDCTLMTLVSIPRYKNIAIKTLIDLDEGYKKSTDGAIVFENLINPFKGLDKKIEINFYKKFTLFYLEKNDDGHITKKIPLTRFYTANGNGIPITSHGMLFPDFKNHIDFARENILNSSQLNKKSSIRDEIFLADTTREFRNYTFKSKDGNSINIWQLAHTFPQHIPELTRIIEKTFNEYQKEISKKDYDNAIKSISKVVWLFANTCPYKRGSFWSAEILGASMLRNIPKYKDLNLMRSDIDFLAFGNSLENFGPKFLDLINEKTLKNLLNNLSNTVKKKSAFELCI